MPNNTVPLGREGTGNAVIYGRNPVAAQFGNQLTQLRQNEYNDELLKQQRAQQEAKQVAADWQKNLLKVDGGLYWQPEFDKRANDLLQQGINLKQSNIDPWGYNAKNPEASQKFLLDKQGIETDSEIRQAKEKQIAEQFKALKENPTAFRQKSIEALNNYINTPFSQVRNAPVPQLEQAYDMEKELLQPLTGKAVTTPTTTKVIQVDPKNPQKDIKVSYKEVDPEPTKTLVASTYLGTPKGRQDIEDKTGVPLHVLNQIPNTLDEVKKLPEFTYEGNPDLQHAMALSGVTTKEQAQPILDKLAKEYYQPKKIYNDILDAGVRRASAGLNLVDSTIPDMTRFNAAEKLKADADRRKREARLATQGTNQAADVRRNWISDIQDYNIDAINKLVAAGNGKVGSGYDPADHFSYNKFKLHIPAKVDKVGLETSPARTVDINRSMPNFETFMNNVIGDVTGAYVDLGSTGAKSANLKKSPPSTPVPVAAPAKTTYKIKGKNYNLDVVKKHADASGMTIDEYIKEANK